MAERVPSRVLVAEDDVVNGSLLREMLASAGYQVAWARDGEETLAFIAPEGPDLIVLDLMMPKVDGFEVLRRLKDDRDTHFIPIVVVTALSDADSRIRAIDLGADDFVTKPFNRTEVIARVRSLLRTKELYDEVQAQLRSVKRLEGVKRLLVQFVMHDLQNPLTAVMANIEIALREMEAGGSQSETKMFLGDAMRGAQRVHDLLLSLLDIEKMEEGRLDLRVENLKLAEVLASVANMQRSWASTRRVAIEVDCDAGLLVDGDDSLLRRVFGNLAANAVRFAPDDSVVRLCASVDRGRVLVRVSDQGPGVPDAVRERIFEKFHQGVSARERGGFGLGLTFCKMVVEAHRGLIWVEDCIDGRSGATFVVSLPGGSR